MNLRGSIAYILLKDGEATPRQLSDKLGTDTTSVTVALKAMFDAHEVTREKIWDVSSGIGGYTFKYRHKSAAPATLADVAPTAIEQARYVWLDGKKAGRLTDTMFAQVQRHGFDGESSIMVHGPNPATQDQRVAAKQRGMALPGNQYITLNIEVFKDKAEDSQKYFGLIAPNKRTLDYLLLWHPEFRLGN